VVVVVIVQVMKQFYWAELYDAIDVIYARSMGLTLDSCY